MNTRSLTGNRDRDKGWIQTPDGNWTPSVYDRRRVGVAEMQMAAEAVGADAVPAPIVVAILGRHAVDEADHEALVRNFEKWMQGLQG